MRVGERVYHFSSRSISQAILFIILHICLQRFTKLVVSSVFLLYLPRDEVRNPRFDVPLYPLERFQFHGSPR